MNKLLGNLTQEHTDLVYKLRNETGYGIVDCKKALLNSNWNYFEAVLSISKNQHKILK